MLCRGRQKQLLLVNHARARLWSSGNVQGWGPKGLPDARVSILPMVRDEERHPTQANALILPTVLWKKEKKCMILLTEKGARDAKPPHSSLPAPGPTFQGRKVITRRVNPVPPTKHFSGRYQSLRSVITTLTGELFWTGDFIFLGEELRFWRGAKAIVVAAQIFAIFPIMRR